MRSINRIVIVISFFSIESQAFRLSLLGLLLLSRATLSQQSRTATGDAPERRSVTKPYQTSLFVPPLPYPAKPGLLVWFRPAVDESLDGWNLERVAALHARRPDIQTEALLLPTRLFRKYGAKATPDRHGQTAGFSYPASSLRRGNQRFARNSAIYGCGYQFSDARMLGNHGTLRS